MLSLIDTKIYTWKNRLKVSYNPSNSKYIEWYSPYFDLEHHTIQVCRGDSVKTLYRQYC